MKNMRPNSFYLLALILPTLFLACNLLQPEPPLTDTPPTKPSPENTAESKPTTELMTSTELVLPEDLVYQGAFRLPNGEEEYSWAWGGAALTYYPGGDPDGPDDGYPGSLFGTGHDWYQNVSEISIPVPVISPTKVVSELNTAVTLQDFQDIREDMFDHLDYEVPRAGLEYMPRQGEQTSDKLYFCWGQHYQDETSTITSHGWSELDLSDPQSAGPWSIANSIIYSVNDYLFAIPMNWADHYTPGKYLATGRYRDGGWSGQGPSLYAIDPWNEGTPPPPGAQISSVPLLLYGYSHTPNDLTMENYSHADEWGGGAWLTAGSKSAVIFAGTKGVGETWYGFANGVVWPDEGPFPPIPEPPNDARGWWATALEAQIIFYDPADLAAVARGEIEPHQPQPYAALTVDQHLFNHHSNQQKYLLGAVGFDRERGLLYVFELFGDGEMPLIHVWKIIG
jgi:hypothetical protein